MSVADNRFDTIVALNTDEPGRLSFSVHYHSVTEDANRSELHYVTKHMGSDFQLEFFSKRPQDQSALYYRYTVHDLYLGYNEDLYGRFIIVNLPKFIWHGNKQK